MSETIGSRKLCETAEVSPDKIFNQDELLRYGGVDTDRPVLVILAAGKGTRFGRAPKCAQPICGVPLARHSIEAFRQFKPAPVISVVG